MKQCKYREDMHLKYISKIVICQNEKSMKISKRTELDLIINFNTFKEFLCG